MTAIVALGSVCLAGSPLYLSSVATAALRSELAHTCLADVGLRIPMVGVLPDTSVRLEAIGKQFAGHTQPGVLTRIALNVQLQRNGSITLSRAHLVYRDGQEENLGRPVTAPVVGEVLAPEWLGQPEGTKPGDRLKLFSSNGQGVVTWQRSERVVDTYPLVPTRPEPSYWCGLRTLFRSPSSDPADPPTAVLLAPSDEVRAARPATVAEWEVRPDPKGLTRHDAAVLADRFDDAVREARRQVPLDERNRRRPLLGGEPLRAVVRHAEASTAVVAGTMAPVRLVALLACVTLLLAATTLLVREQRSELRLRLLKGQAPPALGLRVAGRALPGVVLGSALGGALAFAAVRLLGPAPELETAAIRQSFLAAAAGAVGAFAVVAAVAAQRAGALVDAPVRHRSPLRWFPWEAVAVAAAVVAFVRLDHFGGIQQIGVNVEHADFWAQCFPLLAIIAPLAVLARPMFAVLRRWRLAGRGLPPSVMTGVRRALAEPGVTLAVVLATALAVGSFTLSRVLTDSTSVLLTDKAGTFLGSDLAIITRDVSGLPPPFDASGTVVARTQGHSGSQAIDLLGVDTTTFDRGVHWRDDAASASLRDLLDAITATAEERAAGSTTVPAIVVGGTLPETELRSLVQRPIAVRPVATARWFPGLHNGSVLVVVDRAALTSRMSTSAEIWLAHPPADAAARLTAAGIVVRSPRGLDEVFNVTSFLTVRWAYATVSMLGMLAGIVVLFAQLLVLDARRQARQAAHVLTTRMGLTRRGEAIGLVAELAPPLFVGAVLGTLLGWVVSRLSIARLDSLRQLRPPARAVAHPSQLVPIVTGVAGAVVVLVVIGLTMISRTRAVEVMRGTA